MPPARCRSKATACASKSRTVCASSSTPRLQAEQHLEGGSVYRQVRPTISHAIDNSPLPSASAVYVATESGRASVAVRDLARETRIVDVLQHASGGHLADDATPLSLHEAVQPGHSCGADLVEPIHVLVAELH